VDETGGPGDTDEEDLTIEVGTQKGDTMVRMIIDLWLYPVPMVAGSVEVMEVDLGIGLVSVDLMPGSLNVGIEGAVPQSGWLWRDRVFVPEISQAAGRVRLTADIRAQRKLMYGEPRLFVTYALSQGDGFNVTVQGIIRTLFLKA